MNRDQARFIVPTRVLGSSRKLPSNRHPHPSFSQWERMPGEQVREDLPGARFRVPKHSVATERWLSAGRSCAGLRRLSVLFAALCWLALAPPARAILPEPDNLVYGAITISGQPITAAHTTFQVQARRPNGQVVARYRMGANPSYGDFFSVRLPIEAALPLLNPNSSLPGESVVLVLRDPDGDIAQIPFETASRGTAIRADFVIGIPHEDSDGNGLPDAWEIFHFGAIGQDPDALSPNGMTTLQNYVAGTDPADPDSRCALHLDADDDQIVVSFLARRAQGPGYDNRNRFYTLEQTAALDQDWSAVPGCEKVPGNDQFFQHHTTADSAQGHFRARVWLEP